MVPGSSDAVFVVTTHDKNKLLTTNGLVAKNMLQKP